MSRLEKKCIVAATGSHALLFVILLVGPAFFVARDRVQPAQQISVIAGKVVDDALSSGGSTTVAPPLPQRQDPQPPAPPAHADPPKRNDPPEPVKHEPTHEKSFEPAVKPKTHQTELNPAELKPVHKTTNITKKNTTTKSTDDARDQELAKQKQIADQLARDIKGLGKEMNKAVAVDAGPVGNGGEAVTSYKDIVYTKYYNAWSTPAMSEKGDLKTTVSITIARDGKVIDSHITRRSGNAALDKSIENLIENVTFVQPFSEQMKSPQMQFTLTFKPTDKE
jgi:colicin import membrane protein